MLMITDRAQRIVLVRVNEPGDMQGQNQQWMAAFWNSWNKVIAKRRPAAFGKAHTYLAK